jgi:hypothetical protein
MGLGATSITPRTATTPPTNAMLRRARVRMFECLRLRAIDTANRANTIAQSPKVASCCLGVSSVNASRMLDIGAMTSYAIGVLRLACAGAALLATSTTGDAEKAAVTETASVMTSGQRYLETCLRLGRCTCPD